MEREIIAWPDEARTRRHGPGLGTYLRPWATTVGLIPAGWAAHLAWGDAGLTTGLAATGITAAGACVTWLSWRLCRARTWYAALVPTATAGGITAWMATATVAGTGRPWVDLLVVGGGALSGLINIHTWQRGQQGSGRDGTSVWDRPLPSWEEVAEIVGLKGTRMTVTEDSDLRRVGTVQLRPGQTVDAIQGSLRAIASAMRLPRTAVRAVEDPADSSRAQVTIVRRDVLRDPIEWRELTPDEVGISIADAPLTLGTYEDGGDFTDNLFDHHTLTIGMSGSGKSVYGKLKLLQVAARRDAVVLAVDLAKGRQTLGPVAPAILWPAYTMQDARALLAALQRAVKARADYLGARGLENWQKDCGLVFVHVLLEEAAELVDVDTLVDLMRVARSAGIHIEASLQRATYTNLDTDARANFASRMCFGVADPQEAARALPDHVIAAGAAPDQWGTRQPGTCYAAVVSQPEDRHSVPLRIYRATNDALAAAAAALPDQDAKLDTVTRAAFGQAYEDHLRRARGETEEITPAATVDHQEQTVTEDPAVTYTTPDPDPDLPTPTLDDPIEMPPGGDFALGPAARSRESAAAARARLDAQLQIWADQGHNQFRAPELLSVLRSSGLQRKRGWLLGELKRLEAEGRILHHDGGEYELVPADHPVAA